MKNIVSKLINVKLAYLALEYHGRATFRSFNFGTLFCLLAHLPSNNCGDYEEEEEAFSQHLLLLVGLDDFGRAAGATSYFSPGKFPVKAELPPRGPCVQTRATAATAPRIFASRGSVSLVSSKSSNSSHKFQPSDCKDCPSPGTSRRPLKMRPSQNK